MGFYLDAAPRRSFRLFKSETTPVARPRLLTLANSFNNSAQVRGGALLPVIRRTRARGFWVDPREMHLVGNCSEPSGLDP